MRTLGLLVVCGAIALGCGDDDGGPADTGTGDTSMADVGMTDTGSDTGGDDAGDDDAGSDAGADAGDDAGADSGADTGPADAGMCPDLMATDPGELVISQIDVAGKRVEVYNPGDTDVVIGEHVFCSRPSYRGLGESGPSTVPAGGYAVYTLPDTFQLEHTASGGGELALYVSRTYNDETTMLDFVCWNGTRSATRKAVAERDPAKWGGDCADSTTMDAVIRLPSTAGTSAADYDVTAAFAETVCE